VQLQAWACWGRYGFDARHLQMLSRQNSGTLRDGTFSLQVYGRSSTSFETPGSPESLLRGRGFHDCKAVEHDAFLRRQFAVNETRTTMPNRTNLIVLDHRPSDADCRAGTGRHRSETEGRQI